MADLDNSTIPFKHDVIAITFNDGTSPSANTLAVYLIQGTVTWSEPGRTKVEARDRNRHQGTPVVVETDDGNVTGSITLLCTSWKGSSNTHPYEFMTFTGTASSFASTGAGGANLIEMVLTTNSTADGGGSQTVTFAHCDFSDISVDTGGTDGLCTITANFTDYENRPTMA